MNKLLLALFGLLALTAVALAAESSQWTSRLNVTASTDGSIRFVVLDDHSKTFTFRLTSAQEVVHDGGPVRSLNSFNQATFNPSSTSNPGGPTGSTASVTLNANVDNAIIGTISNETYSATFTTNVYLFANDSKATLGGSQYSVGAGSAYVLISLNNWPVVATNNTLKFESSISTPGKTGSISATSAELFDGAVVTYIPVATLGNFGASWVGTTLNLQVSSNSTSQQNYGFLFNAEAVSQPSSASALSSILSFLF